MLGQLPVRRDAADAALVLKEAEKRLEQGAAVVIYPEETATRDPELWPMAARTDREIPVIRLTRRPS